MRLIKILICLLCTSGVIQAESSGNQFLGLQEYYSTITKAAKTKNWWNVIYFSKIALNQYPKNEISSDIIYYLAEAYFHVNQYELSNKYFSEYLTREFSPKYYEEAIMYKFRIAKNYYEGTKKPLFGLKRMPKIIPAKEDALKLFDEVLNAMPNSDVAIESLFYKGKIHADLEDYKESIEAFQTLIRKYPKHDYAIDSFLEIEKVYLKQADPKHQDPNLLDLAEINLKRFKEAFPKEPRVTDAEENFRKIQEIYAQGLYEIGRFYERTKKVDSSEIYYKKVVSVYPDSNSAKLSLDRLDKLKKK
jgi:outer membrane protein assembly factor BamD (BamD/ComL family)